MSTAAIKPLADVSQLPLTGAHLLQASAGTGKTWTLCSIVLRLVLEQGLRLDQVLVVTFTRAATDELRSRLRERLEVAQQVLQQPLSALNPSQLDVKVTNDVLPFLQHALRQKQTQETLKARVDQALGSIDDAAVFTIHSFFQRSLKAAAFSAGQSVDLKLEGNDQALRATVLADAWRKQVDMGALDPALISMLYDRGDSPLAWASALDEWLKLPKAVVTWHEAQAWDPRVRQRHGPALESAWARLKQLWVDSHAELHAAVDEAVSDGRLPQKQRNATLRRIDEVLAWVQRGDPFLALNGDTVSRLLAGPLASHRALMALDAVDDILQPFVEHVARARLHLARSVLTQAMHELRLVKQRKQTLSYDDLLHDMLLRLQAQPAMADALRERYPAALIDEFQDTDAVQLAVFDAIYPKHALDGSLLVMVGDPKQSIYAFRGADLPSYLSVYRRGIPVHTLEVNHRSTPALVAATNALLTQHSATLGEPDIQPTPVKAGKAAMATTSTNSKAAAISLISIPYAQNGDPMTGADAKAWAARVCARWIAQRLAAVGDEDAVAGGDIAVIVQTHFEGAVIRDALAQVGVASLDRSRSSVFATRTAAELSLILRAVMDPSHGGAVRAAWATQALGATAQELDASMHEAVANDTTAAGHDWLAWRDLWQRRGVASMLGRLQQDAGLVQRILPLPHGERWMTDWMHLIDLLGEAEQSHRSMASLLRWFDEQRANPRHTEERTDNTRLDSERALVKIVTVHGAKGLQYPIVVLPFLWWPDLGPRGGKRRTSLDTLSHHDAHGQLRLDFFASRSGPAYENARASADEERRKEQLRKFYVALTRAQRQCVLVHDVQPRKIKGSVKPSLCSELNWLVAGNGSFADWRSAIMPVDLKKKPQVLTDRVAQIETAWRKLVDSNPGLIDTVDAAALLAKPLPQARATSQTLQANVDAKPAPVEPSPLAAFAAFAANGPYTKAWWPTSFTALTRRLELDDEPTQTLIAAPSDVPLDDFLRFPRGVAAGTTFHAAIERADLSNPATWESAVATALRMHPLHAPLDKSFDGRLDQPSGEPHQGAKAMLMQALERLSRTPLRPAHLDPFHLGQITTSNRRNELGFEMALSIQDPHALVARLEALDLPVPPMAAGEWQAWSQRALSLRGFIDQVFVHDGRVHLLDWKTNALGWTAQDHGREALAACLHEHGYHLQHVLYAVALWRELVARHGRQAADARWGGTFILFVRGVRPDWVQADGSPCGVFHRRLSADELDSLSDLLGLPA